MCVIEFSGQIKIKVSILHHFSTIEHPVVGEINVCTLLGSGAYAEVWRAFCPAINSHIALKVQRPDSIINKEIEILKACNHPFISRFLFSVNMEGIYGYASELIRGQDILQYVNFNGPLDEEVALPIVLELVSAIKYLHNELHVVHRDLKCENIILDESMNVKIIDFGFADVLTTERPVLTTQCGSLAYLSPEVVQGFEYGYETDIWSLGIVLYAIIEGSLPFNADSLDETMDLICKSEPNFSPTTSSSLVNLISRMLTKDPKKRITLDEILQHPWCKPVKNGIQYTNNLSPIDNIKVIPKNVTEIDHDVIRKIKLVDNNVNHLIDNLLNSDETIDSISYIAEKLKLINCQLLGISNLLLPENDRTQQDHLQSCSGYIGSKALTKPSFNTQMLDRSALYRMSCSGTPAQPLVTREIQSRRAVNKKIGSILVTQKPGITKKSSKPLLRAPPLLPSLLK